MKLQTKLNLATGIILFITLSAMMTVDIIHDRDLYFQTQREVLERSAESLRNLLARVRSVEEIGRTVSAFSPALTRPGRGNTIIVVSDHKETILASTLHAVAGMSIRDLPAMREFNPEVSGLQAILHFHQHPEIHIAIPFPLDPSITGEQAPVRGHILIKRSLEEEYREFLAEFVFMGIYIMLLFAFLVALFTYFFHHFITAPVNRLIAGVKKVEEGAWETRVEVAHNDEIGTLSEAFNRMAHQLETTVEHMLRVEKMTTLGEMAARVAHEIRNPLVPIGGLANNMAHKMPEGSRERSHLEIIVREVKRLEKILESILVFTKEAPPTFQHADINDIIAISVRIVELYIEKGHVIVETDLQPDIPAISCDAAQMEQALVNLFYNSVQAMDDTGGRLSVRSAYQTARDRVIIEVSDTGGGIAEKDIHRIFDPFFTTKETGTGLGLTIVHQIVASHSGNLMVHNHPGEGVTFLIELPTKQSGAEPKVMRPHVVRGR